MTEHVQLSKANKSACVALTLIAVMTFFCGATHAASESETAQRFYSSGDMMNAVKHLDADLLLNPSNATSHYLKANCLVKLQRLPEAVNEYSLAERLSPNSKLAGYCKTAKTNILSRTSGSRVETKSRVLQSEDPDNDADNLDEKVSVQKAVVDETRPVPKNSLPPGTLEMIRKQAVMARQRALETGQAEAQGELSWAENAAKSMREKAERAASHGKNSNEPVTMSPQEAEAIRSQAATTGDRLRELGRRNAAIKEWESQEKADEIKQQADNLQERLLDNRKSRYTDVKLNPVGTNLYIRNYAKPPIVPLKVEAKMVSLDSAISAGRVGAKAKADKLDGNGKAVSTGTSAQVSGTRSVVSVKGQLLPK